MDFFYVDDSGRQNPQRKGMGPLLAVGGFCISEESIRELEQELENLCLEAGFPPGEVFKWSPQKDLWMRDNLKGVKRRNFFINILIKLYEHNAISCIIIEDTKYKTATKAQSPEIDLTQLLLERANFELRRRQTNGTIIVSQPSGDRTKEYKFLGDCVEILKQGTSYSGLEKITQVLCLNHKYSRFLQAADLVTSCTTAFVSGESQYSPPVFEYIRPTLAKDLGRIGGVGLKIHPDIVYVNLYHWLLGDNTFWKGSVGIPLPLTNREYYSGPDIP